MIWKQSIRSVLESKVNRLYLFFDPFQLFEVPTRLLLVLWVVFGESFELRRQEIILHQIGPRDEVTRRSVGRIELLRLPEELDGMVDPFEVLLFRETSLLRLDRSGGRDHEDPNQNRRQQGRRMSHLVSPTNDAPQVGVSDDVE